ncbi:N-6 DNA methylase [groundwater metagenome]
MVKNDNKTQEEPLEKQLWKTADKLRKNIDAAEYKHIVMGLIFLKYISDAFEGLYDKLQKVKKGDSSIPQEVLFNCWWKCWNPTMAGSLTHAVARAVCLSNRKSSFWIKLV